MHHSSQLALFHHPVDGIQRPVDSLYHCCNVEKPSSAFWSVTACVTRSRLYSRTPIRTFDCIVHMLEESNYLKSETIQDRDPKRPSLLYVAKQAIPSHVSEIRYSIPSHPPMHKIVRGAGDLQQRRIFDCPSEREITHMWYRSTGMQLVYTKFRSLC